MMSERESARLSVKLQYVKLMIYLMWKMDDTVVTASVTYEQLTGLIKVVKSESALAIEWFHQGQNLEVQHHKTKRDTVQL